MTSPCLNSSPGRLSKARFVSMLMLRRSILRIASPLAGLVAARSQTLLSTFGSPLQDVVAGLAESSVRPMISGPYAGRPTLSIALFMRVTFRPAEARARPHAQPDTPAPITMTLGLCAIDAVHLAGRRVWPAPRAVHELRPASVNAPGITGGPSLLVSGRPSTSPGRTD